MTQKQSRSPFILIEDAIPSYQCEDIVLNLKHTIPNRDSKNVPIKTLKTNQLAEVRLMPMVDNILEKAETYYDFKTLNVSPFNFEWMTEGFQGGFPTPDNGTYFNGKWTKTKDIDFTLLIFLSTTQDNSIQDTLMESFGGKLEFFNHNLTIKPKAGTIIMFPANEYFLNCFTEIQLGNLNCIRIYITAERPYVYNPDNFPGDFRTWF